MVDKDRGQDDLYGCDYERLAELNEYINRLEEEARQLSERVEKVEEEHEKFVRKTLLKCALPNAILIAVLLAFIILTVLH